MSQSPSNVRQSSEEFQTLAYLLVHNLKEPIRTIRTGAELLLELENSDGGTSESASLLAPSAARILGGALRLEDLASSIAHYADDLGREDEPLEPTNAEATLRAVRQKLTELIQTSGATISNGPLPTFECQPSGFSALLEALVKNGIYYRSEQPPKIHVSAERSGADWLFAVSDNGVGIAPADLERVFEPMSRLRSTGYRGLGMGLVTCRRIVARHGGRIWVESKVGLGSKVSFLLPA